MTTKMEHLTEPLIECKSDKALLQDDGTLPSISEPTSENNSLEDDQLHEERVSSFIDVGNHDIPRATTYTLTAPITLRNGKRRGLTVPATGAPPELGANFMQGSPRSSYSSTRECKKQSVIVAGDDHFILEEPNPDSFQTTDKNYIDGRHSTGLGVSQFVNVHYVRGDSTGDTSTSLALEICRKTVLRPYFIYMKMGYNERIKISSNCSFIYASCKDVIVTSLIIPDLVVLAAYIVGFFIFRYVFPENLANLTETVFLGYTANHGAFSQKRLVYSLRVIIVIGVVWQVYAVGLNVTRLFSLELLKRHTYIDVIDDYSKDELIQLYDTCNGYPPPENNALRYVLVIVSIVSFIITDFFYLATVIHYALECQLIMFLMRGTADRIRSRCWAVDLAIKEIKVSQDFLKVLNGHLSYMVSLVLFVFIGLWLEAARALYQLDSGETFVVVITVLNLIQWSVLIALPVVQALRLTVTGNEIETLGQELRTRPFVYSDAAQLDLDSLVMYTSNLNMSAKLVNVPMRSCVVLPAVFFGVILWRQLTAGDQLALGRWF
ncbi:uncharacterized protein [Dysidea avara]|uniref:uncharacterized protein isoform X2 n=1 Tax=Dysidea avara TaxID=196820 RepID=UPI00331C435C